MADKSVNDYLTDGIYGKKLPKQEERNKYLGTLRERIVLALTIGQVMSDKGLEALEEEMRKHPNAFLMFNGNIASKYLNEEKQLAENYQIPYTIMTNGETKTNIGAVLTYDYAIDKEDIFIEEKKPSQSKIQQEPSLFHKIFKWGNK